jgi:sRNA-binding protein
MVPTMNELEQLISEAAEEYASEALAEADAKITQLRKEMQKALDAERKAAIERKEYGEAIEKALQEQTDAINNSAATVADSIARLANALAKKVAPQAPNYRFKIIRDETGKITELAAEIE